MEPIVGVVYCAKCGQKCGHSRGPPKCYKFFNIMLIWETKCFSQLLWNQNHFGRYYAGLGAPSVQMTMIIGGQTISWPWHAKSFNPNQTLVTRYYSLLTSTSPIHCIFIPICWHIPPPQGWIRDFREGVQTPRGAPIYYLVKFSRKLHENDKNWAGGLQDLSM